MEVGVSFDNGPCCGLGGPRSGVGWGFGVVGEGRRWWVVRGSEQRAAQGESGSRLPQSRGRHWLFGSALRFWRWGGAACRGLRRSMAKTKAVSRPPQSKTLARGAGAKWFARSFVRDRRPGDEPSAQGTVRITLGGTTAAAGSGLRQPAGRRGTCVGARGHRTLSSRLLGEKAAAGCRSPGFRGRPELREEMRERLAFVGDGEGALRR